MLSGSVPLEEQCVNVVGRILPAVLMDDPGILCQTHGGESVILGDDDIALRNPVDQCKIHTVCAFVENKGLRAIFVHGVGSVA